MLTIIVTRTYTNPRIQIIQGGQHVTTVLLPAFCVGLHDLAS